MHSLCTKSWSSRFLPQPWRGQWLLAEALYDGLFKGTLSAQPLYNDLRDSRFSYLTVFILNYHKIVYQLYKILPEEDALLVLAPKYCARHANREKPLKAEGGQIRIFVGKLHAAHTLWIASCFFCLFVCWALANLCCLDVFCSPRSKVGYEEGSPCRSPTLLAHPCPCLSSIFRRRWWERMIRKRASTELTPAVEAVRPTINQRMRLTF